MVELLQQIAARIDEILATPYRNLSSRDKRGRLEHLCAQSGWILAADITGYSRITRLRRLRRAHEADLVERGYDACQHRQNAKGITPIELGEEPPVQLSYVRLTEAGLAVLAEATQTSVSGERTTS